MFEGEDVLIVQQSGGNVVIRRSGRNEDLKDHVTVDAVHYLTRRLSTEVSSVTWH